MEFKYMSLFQNDRKSLEQISISSSPDAVEATPHYSPKGVVLRLPIIMTLNGNTRKTKVKAYLNVQRIIDIALLVGVPVEVNKADVAANRPKFCKNGHRQISVNVIHWPNGNEDCRVCYESYPSNDAKKQAEPSAT